MRYLSKRFISILLSFAFIAMSLVLYINFIKPTYADIKVDQGRLAALNDKNQTYKEIFSKLKGISEQLKKSPDLQNRVSMALPLSANTPDSLNQIASIASANGLSITSVDLIESPILPTTGGKTTTASIVKGIGVLKNNVRVTGSYEQLKSFLQGVESGVRISSIKSFKIDRVLNAANPNTFNITLEIETYYQTTQ
jgi:Tfp pilus assembly protein PilO